MNYSSDLNTVQQASANTDNNEHDDSENTKQADTTSSNHGKLQYTHNNSLELKRLKEDEHDVRSRTHSSSSVNDDRTITHSSSSVNDGTTITDSLSNVNDERTITNCSSSVNDVRTRKHSSSSGNG